MKKTIDSSEFCNEMVKHGFSYNGAKELFDFFEEMEEDGMEEIEFDPIAIRCEYTEYGSIEDVMFDYGFIEDIDDLQGHTVILEFNGGLIVQDF
jgi:hypothetical protein